VPIFVERFILPLCAALVILLAVTNPMGFDNTQRVTGSVTLILLAYFLAHTIYKQPTAKAEKLFAANALLAFGGPGDVRFWLVDEGDRAVFPIDLFLKIRIVNLQASKASVDSIGIEMLEGTGWTTLNEISTEGMKIFVGQLSLADECRISPSDIHEVFRSEMEPGARFAATGFFQSSHFAFNLPAHPRFRITINDTVGRSAVIETDVAMSDQSWMDETSVQKIGESRDLSQFREKRRQATPR
jgi:hypothetical protein